MKRLGGLIPLFAVLALASCGDSAIFLSTQEEAAEVKVETIEPGLALAPESEIPFRIARDPVFVGDPETADSLVVELLDADGVLLGEQTYTSVDQAMDLPPLQLPDLGDGIFVLRTVYMDGEEPVEEELIPFFVTASEFELVGLSSYPATLYPGSAGLLSVNLEMPVGSDPYVEWYLDDEQIQAGLVSETGNQLELQAPGRSGVYTIRVGLYPFQPVLTGEILRNVEVPPPYSYESELVVSTDPVLTPSDLTPERSYWVLHHFLGDLRDSGARTDMFDVRAGSAASAQLPTSARAIGDPELAVETDVFGYRLDGDDGFELGGLILPAWDGAISPFSVSLRLQPETFTEQSNLLRVAAGTESIFRVFLDDEGRVLLELGQDGTLSTADPLLTVGETSVVTISFWPLGNQTLIQFYVDGELVLAQSVDWNIADPGRIPDPVASTDEGWMALPGSALIGGPDGFAGIIDEFGVYFRDEGDQPSPDTEIFASAMEQAYGDKLVYAEGFEGTTIPEDVRAEGDVEIAGGQLVLGSGGAVLFPAFGFASEELFVTVTLDALAGTAMRFYAESRSGVPLGRTGVAGNETDGPAGDEETTGAAEEPDLATLVESAQLVTELLATDLDLEDVELEFAFTHSGAEMVVYGPGDSTQEIELLDHGNFSGLRLEVAQSGDEENRVAVESVVAWRERPQIPAALLEPPDDEGVPADE